MGDARSLCLGIKWLCEGTYTWLSDDEGRALERMAVALRGAALPVCVTITPEDEALALLDRFEPMKGEENSGLTHRQVERLCIAIGQLTSGRTPIL